MGLILKAYIYLRLFCAYSRTSLLRSSTGLGKSELNGEVTVLQGANVSFFALLNIIWD